ncbi:hypothetical protein [Flavobacterium aestivum]|uniref:hypothetical protein n=1 Tax=Flavobacterium aestivum TaxID=3003257 RepID=UPI0022868435|nr:hypothetical protein [Flavobacterium aestivum]
MWYKVDFNRLAVLMLPTFLRKPLLVAYLQSLLVPIDSLYYKWSIFRNDNLYKVQHTGQICYLRKVLNDKLDVSRRRIYIGDGNRHKRQYLYTKGENRPRYLGTMFLWQNSDYADTGVDFIVYAPQEIINTSPYELKALIEFYKAGGKRYKIEVI